MSSVMRRARQLLGLMALQAALLFVSAGSWRWEAAWLYIGLYVFMVVLASIVLLPRHKDVIEERSKGTRGGTPWDLWITRLMTIPTLGLLVLTGLDQRWNWTPPLSPWFRGVGVLAFSAGYALVVWAMCSNPFFSQVVRIQTERGHAPVTDGPYRFVRHPGYLGMTTSMIGSVFVLDSLWGLACFAGYLALIVTRTVLEDRTLRAELPGYAEYASRTRYRLLPGLW